jgi:hypothetical protein
VEEQTDEEIRQDLLELKAILSPRKMVLVSHYNAKLGEEYLASRNALMELLKGVCAENAIPFLDPTLSEFSQEVMISPDLAHYTQFGMNEFTRKLNAFI